MSNDLRGQFIANTFQNLVQMPDVSKQNFYNGIGATISVINKDGIGTIKMFYPPSGNILDYFDNSGDGIVGKEWEGWSLCDGHRPPVGVQTPDLRGKFIVGFTSGGDSDGDYATFGYVGGEKKQLLSSNELPPHRHEFNYHRFQFDVGHLIDNGDAVDTINNGGIPGYGLGNGLTNDGPTDRNGGTTQQKHENRPPFYTLAYVIRVA